MQNIDEANLAFTLYALSMWRLKKEVGGGNADVAEAWFQARCSKEDQSAGTIDKHRTNSAKCSTFIH